MTATVLAVARTVQRLIDSGIRFRHEGILPDRELGVVMVMGVDVWGHRQALEGALRRDGFEVEVHRVAFEWQIRVTPKDLRA